MREVVNFKGREKMTVWWSDTESGLTESAEVLHDLEKRRSSWFSALWVGGEGQGG